jgi:hypothetical protein
MSEGLPAPKAPSEDAPSPGVAPAREGQPAHVSSSTPAHPPTPPAFLPSPPAALFYDNVIWLVFAAAAVCALVLLVFKDALFG